MRPQYHIWLIGAICSIVVLAVGGLVSALESRGLDPLGWSEATPSATLTATSPPTATPTPLPASLPPSVTAAPHRPKVTATAEAEQAGAVGQHAFLACRSATRADPPTRIEVWYTRRQFTP